MPVDIHALEMDFAKNASLDACMPLCDAYLGAKRYMEAMVVYKKGIKNAPPGDPRGRVMLARIYVEQGKLPKAEQELQSVLVQFPGQPQALGLLGRTYLEQGRKQEATPLLQQALQSDPASQPLRAMLAQLGVVGVALPTAPSLPPRPAAAALPAAPPLARQAGSPAAVPQPSPAAAVTPPRPAATAPQAAAAAGQASADDVAPHVDDFFAPEKLGFAPAVSGDIETAGPGRLTILGFVPKRSGGWKTTLVGILVATLLSTAYLTWVNISSEHQRQKAALFGKVRQALEKDLYGSYKEVLQLGEQILRIDSKHTLTLSALSYAQAVLALDHQEPGAMHSAQAYLHEVMQGAHEDNEFLVAAQAMLQYASKDWAAGLKTIQTVLNKGGDNPLVRLEAFRLADALQPETPETKKQLRMLLASVTSQVRVYNFLGFYYHRQEDYGKAAKYFDSALQNVREHPLSLLGRSLVTLDQGVGLAEKQKEVEADLQRFAALPSSDISPPLRALGHFVKSQLLLVRKDFAAATAAYQQAVQLDADNVLLPYWRGVALLRQGLAREAVVELKKAVAHLPGNILMQHKLAEALIQAEAYAEAKTLLEKLTQDLTGGRDHQAFLLQARLALAQHDAYSAQRIYESLKFDAKSSGALPNADAASQAYVQAQVGLSHIFRQTNRAGQAVGVMEALLSKMPDGILPPLLARVWCELGQGYEALHNPLKAMQSYTKGVEQYRYYAACHQYICHLGGETEAGQQACKTFHTLQQN